ncbi:MAG: hypothetical protein M5U28_25865 [Sandaracinaceae bacterium]|nr:hypothetical protein [Sandaracinaceae bacterium]
MRLDEPLAQVQAETDPTHAALSGGARAVEAREQPRELVGWDARPVVRHRHLDGRGVAFDRDQDLGARLTVLGRVGQEVAEHLLDARRIDRDLCRALHLQSQRVPRIERGGALDQRARQDGEVHRLLAKVQAAGLEARQLQQVADHHVEVARGRYDPGRDASVLLLLRALLEQRGGELDDVDRLAQVVSDHGVPLLSQALHLLRAA